MIKGHQIERKEEVETFLARVKYFQNNDIECTGHTFFRLSEKQRKLFKCEHIKEIILHSVPLLVGIQYNSNYAVFYDFKQNMALKIILEIMPTKIEIVTFMILDKNQIPKL